MGSSLVENRFLLPALAAGLAACGAWLALWLRAKGVAWRLRRRFRRGHRGQHRAREYLERRGFEVLAEEHTAAGHVVVDGARLPYTVRIDYLVRRGGRIYGVEVKTGSRAADPLNRATRRQLLEYSQLLAVDRLLLLDMDERRLMEVSFPAAARRPGLVFLLSLLVAYLLGAVTLLLVP